MEGVGAEEFFCVFAAVEGFCVEDSGGDEEDLAVVGVLARHEVMVGVAVVGTSECKRLAGGVPFYWCCFAWHSQSVAQYGSEDASFVFVEHSQLMYGGRVN